MKRNEQGDAQVKRGKPIGHYRGVEPLCSFVRRNLRDDTWECKHPETKDTHECTEACTTLEWECCPLNPDRSHVLTIPISITLHDLADKRYTSLKLYVSETLRGITRIDVTGSQSLRC